MRIRIHNEKLKMEVVATNIHNMLEYAVLAGL
jgi:hypothetical protein